MLSDLEKGYLRRFADDEALIGAVKRYVELELLEHLPPPIDNDTDQQLGQRLRAVDTAKKLLSIAFDGVVKYRSSNKIKNLDNLER